MSKQDDIEILIIMPVFADTSFFSLICLLLICHCSILPSHKTPLINLFSIWKRKQINVVMWRLELKMSIKKKNKKLSFVKWSSLVNTKQAWEQRLLYTHLIVTLLPNSFTFIQPIGWRSFVFSFCQIIFRTETLTKMNLKMKKQKT